jgi:hypothetical protein
MTEEARGLRTAIPGTGGTVGAAVLDGSVDNGFMIAALKA